MDLYVPCPTICRMTHTRLLCSATISMMPNSWQHLPQWILFIRNHTAVFFQSLLRCWSWFVPALGAPAPGEGRGWWAVGAEGAGASVGTVGVAGPGAQTPMTAAAPSGSHEEMWTLQHLCSLLLQHKHAGGNPRNQAENMKANLPILPHINTVFPHKPGDSPVLLCKNHSKRTCASYISTETKY